MEFIHIQKIHVDRRGCSLPIGLHLAAIAFVLALVPHGLLNVARCFAASVGGHLLHFGETDRGHFHQWGLFSYRSWSVDVSGLRIYSLLY